MQLRPTRNPFVVYVRRRGPLLAQGIAYSLLLGSTPLLLLSVAAASLTYRYMPSLQTGLHEQLGEYLPEAVAGPLARHLETLAAGWPGMGVVGLGVLLLVSKGIFDSLRDGLAGVTGGVRVRSAVWRHVSSLLMTLLAMALVVVLSLDDIVIGLFVRTAGLPHTPLVLKFAAWSLSTLLLAGLLLVMYHAFATTRVRFWRALLTSAGVSVVWHVLGRLGRLSVILFSRYNILYGVFSGAVLFLVWLQLFAHLVLLGGLIVAGREARGITGPLRVAPAPPKTDSGASQDGAASEATPAQPLRSH